MSHPYDTNEKRDRRRSGKALYKRGLRDRFKVLAEEELADRLASAAEHRSVQTITELAQYVRRYSQQHRQGDQDLTESQTVDLFHLISGKWGIELIETALSDDAPNNTLYNQSDNQPVSLDYWREHGLQLLDPAAVGLPPISPASSSSARPGVAQEKVFRGLGAESLPSVHTADIPYLRDLSPPTQVEEEQERKHPRKIRRRQDRR